MHVDVELETFACSNGRTKPQRCLAYPSPEQMLRLVPASNRRCRRRKVEDYSKGYLRPEPSTDHSRSTSCWAQALNTCS
jgi:hypothetical protein